MSESLFERNLKAFEKFRPLIFQRTKAWLAQHPGSSNFSSTRSYPQEIETTKKNAMLIVLGFSDENDLSRILATRSNQQRALLFIEPEIKEFVRIAHQFDFSNIVKDRSIFIYLPLHAGEVPSVLRDFFVAQNALSSNIGVVVAKGSSEDQKNFKFIIETIKSTREIVNLWIGTSVEDSLFGLKCTVDNLPHCLENRGFASLKQKFDGKSIISIASGPSLDEALPTLKTLNKKVAFIACESSLGTLLSAGIEPDFVTALEREEIVTTYFRNAKLSPQAILICPQLLLESSMSAFAGQKAIYTHNTGISVHLGYGFLGECFATGFSAGNLNISAAIFMGFKKIVMVGHNLAFDTSSGVSHARGVSPEAHRDSKQAMISVLSQDETTQVQTETPYMLFKKQIEDEILLHPECAFINTALKGAKIEGTKTARLEDSISEIDFCCEEIREGLHSLSAPLSADDINMRKQSVKKASTLVATKLKSFVRDLEKFVQETYQMRKSLNHSDSLETHRNRYTSFIQRLQDFREGIFKENSYQIVAALLQAKIAPLEREISLLNQRYSKESELISAYFDVVLKILGVYLEFVPQIAEHIAPLTRIEVVENSVAAYPLNNRGEVDSTFK